MLRGRDALGYGEGIHPLDPSGRVPALIDHLRSGELELLQQIYHIRLERCANLDRFMRRNGLALGSKWGAQSDRCGRRGRHMVNLA